ncbi:amino acid/amide ABC transporter ATP-binding protein 2, HAAT family [Roseovarius pacificus]|uniref:Amino acid/amide ABC transporter ATP-binding protein 2, HAAT family n=1 Tax=Roseovarius pacificus TaxID=337701 RepID=A0A1M6Y8Z8_9RHOB|nr:ABC transporter ATP-binding protein [Roseovarius pacificus]GGO51168.1 ABC transporter ATP-binding protein [Roseovarius pacificus]SHL14776.1 amino acid/amide ABC transporter ATP-binding protein 2, HAAT family [Roseovarius pacificus]
MTHTIEKSQADTPGPETQAMLEVQGLNGWYGESHVLHDVNLTVNKGEVVTLLGRNGAGKTTTLKAIMGLLKSRSGSIRFNGTELIDLPARDIARLGIGYVPDDRGIFGSLSVLENLLLPPKVADGGFDLPAIYELFPNLEERLDSYGNKLSGGEQQMLSIARILRTGALFVLMDEPTEGLAPVIIHQIGHTVRRLKKAGFTILLVEQNFHFARELADRHYIVQEGKVVDQFRNDEIADNLEKIQGYLGI